MTNAQKYFDEQMQNKDFAQSYYAISEQNDIEWELERVKAQIKDNTEKTSSLKN